ncbi:DUF1496 domain-containing protein [Yersinia kristensenii]|uniref:DUF1496 domain-containing protein n=1 Tax=Yersinia kristensenii TaxID=28152 RepID=UPI0005DE14D0|nr:DUF1496 domain-containing protein [Yersinia kristensenii]CNF29515.1 Uncharacterised protein [Yersinia kristensenii]
MLTPRILCLAVFISNFAAADIPPPHDFLEIPPINEAPKIEPRQFLRQVGEHLKGNERGDIQQERLIALIEKISLNIEVIRAATLRRNEHCLFDGKAYSLGAIHQSLMMECRKDNDGVYYWSK